MTPGAHDVDAILDRARPLLHQHAQELAHHAGCSGEARVAFSWPDAYEKAKATAAIFVKRSTKTRITLTDQHCS